MTLFFNERMSPAEVGRSRVLDWDGCRWARDLGGLPTRDGRATRRGAVARAGSLDEVTPTGWRAIEAHGIRTVVDLRNDDEVPPTRREVVRVALDGIEHRDFWDHWSSGPWFGTPLYYGPFLERFPDRAAAAVRAIATAPPGGVLFHCGRGRDRTGLVAILVLAAVGVPAGEIAADYELSDAGDESDRWLAAQGTSPGAVIEQLLAELDVEAALRRGGLGDAELAALRARLVE